MKRVQSSTSDKISTLPSNITDIILKCLPLRDAVRTSVLSSKWRYKWATLPELIFHGKFFQESLAKRKLKTIIYQVLLLHNGPLVKFELFVPHFTSCTDINHWILILLKKNVREFTLLLDSGPSRRYHPLPSHLFSFQQLRHMIFSSCVFAPPPTFKGFSRLVELELRNVVIVCETETFAKFISNCPVLERLALFGCTEFYVLEINAPNLKYFDFSGIFKSLSFIRAALLAEISVALLSEQHEERQDSNLIDFFRCLPAIEKLSLDEKILEFLVVGGLPKRLPTTLNCLKTLILYSISFDKIGDVSSSLCLIRSSPNLQMLEMSCFTNAVNMEAVTELLQAQDFPEFALNSLREVVIYCFSGVEPEMLFVKFLLACSTALEEMEILLGGDIPSAKEYEMVKRLTQFPRASPNAELRVSE